MGNSIEVKVNLIEFTYRDERGYHTVVGYGKVPRDNLQVQEALDKKWLEEIVKPAAALNDGKTGGSGSSSNSSGKKK